MKVSIITVCYNSAATIKDTIISVLEQDYADIEYIIIDGASKDGTMDIVNQYKDRITKIVSEPDKGIYDAMNKGIQLATGDVVGILNSDDFYESKDVLSHVVKGFKQSNTVDVVFGDLVFVKPTDLTKVTRLYALSNYAAWKLRYGWMPPHPATFIRREIYIKHGLYKIDFKIAADYELFVRLLLVKGVSFKHINKVLIRMRSGGASTSGFMSSLTLNNEIIRACKMNGIYTNMLFLILKIPFKLFELFKRPVL